MAKSESRLFIVLHKEWKLNNASNPTDIREKMIPPGKHEVERIPNPLGVKGAFWLVLAGTRTGAGENFLRGFESHAGEDRIEFVTH